MTKCNNCGGDGPHFAPPSLGEEGFYTCKKATPSVAERLRALEGSPRLHAEAIEIAAIRAEIEAVAKGLRQDGNTGFKRAEVCADSAEAMGRSLEYMAGSALAHADRLAKEGE